jgi:signal transduction histidine kinase
MSLPDKHHLNQSDPNGGDPEMTRPDELVSRSNEQVLPGMEHNYQTRQTAQELALAYEELAYQNEQKEKRAQELVTANKELAYQNDQKEKRAAELAIANKELEYQNEQKEKRAAELVTANEELAYQNEQKEERAAELVTANKELAYQNEQKEKRAAELVTANEELAYQNEQKEKRAAELVIANKELAYQNEQKEKRAAELELANIELAFQNVQKEQRAIELAQAIKDLDAFAYVSSHHLQEPLRKIRSFVDRVLDRDARNLTEKGKHDLDRIDVATARMSQLIQDVFTYSRISVNELAVEKVDAGSLVRQVLKDFHNHLEEKKALVTADFSLPIFVEPPQFRQAIHLLIDNALKFAHKERSPQIIITGTQVTGDQIDGAPQDKTYCCIEIKDNGIGFDPKYSEAIFGIFSRLHSVAEYPGTGVGLAIVKKIMNRHKGFAAATGEAGTGAAFQLYFPAGQE